MDYKFNAIFESENNKIEMNKDSEIKIKDIEGIEASSYTINTISSNQDGTRNDKERKIQYRVSSFDFTTNKLYEDIDFTIVLESTEDPYFEDAKNKGNNLALISPQFAFPLVIRDTPKGKIMGYRVFKQYMPLINDGDKETGIEIVITAKRGAMKNIKLTLNDDKYVKVNQVLNQWDVLIINTNPRKKRVTLNGANIINKIDRTSTFFSLRIGKNILKYECEDGVTNVDIEVKFYRKFLGV